MQKSNEQPTNQQADHSRPWWQAPFLGYLFAVGVVAVAFLIPWSEQSMGIPDRFLEPPFVLAMLLVGMFWGLGPALLALVLEVLALDYWLVPPFGSISFFLWPELASFIPFILTQLLLLGLVLAQKKARHQLLLAHRAASRSTEQLAASNQALSETNLQLDQANRIKDLFLSRASHELKTPITAIQGQAQLALRRLERGQLEPASLKKIEMQTHRLNVLVNDLMDLSSLRSGKMPLRPVSCNLNALCEELAEEQREVTGRGVELNLSINPLVVRADETRVMQVLTNLLSNALKYSPADSVVSVELLCRPAQALVAVHNEGSVLSQEEQEAIFEPFYRTSQTQASATPGWGLGLAISKEIVEQHGGHLWVESSQEKGTTFFVALPLQEQ